MKIKLCQGLWLVSLDKCLMQIENCAISSLLENIAGGFGDPPEGGKFPYVNIIYFFHSQILSKNETPSLTFYFYFCKAYLDNVNEETIEKKCSFFFLANIES
jgi:hypothetical protein